MNRIPAIILGVLAVIFLAAAAQAEPWPYMPFDQTHGLGNHFGEYQNYGGSPYYHDGDDLVTPSGPVMCYSVSDGTMNHITYNQPLYSGLMIGEPVSGGEGWLYWHINSTTFQFDIGDPVYTNDYIGTTAYWTVSSFHHVHFNKIVGTGGYPWGWYQSVGNPLQFMVPNDDPDPPVFEMTYNNEVFAFRRDGTGTILDHTSLTGNVDIVSRIKDIVGLPQWGLNPWRVNYWIDGATQSVPVTNSVTFSGNIPPDNTIPVIYSTSAPLSTAGNYNSRIFYIIVTNTDGDGFVESGDAGYSWQTGSFAPGDYWTYVRAEDVGGNVVVDSMLCTIAGVTNPDVYIPEMSHDFGTVGLDETETWELRVVNVGTDYLSVRETTSSNAAFTVDRSHFYVPPGGGEVAITVSFTPIDPILYLGGITIRTNDADEPQINVVVRGQGRDPAAVEDVLVPVELAIRGMRALPHGGLAMSYALDRSGDVALEVFDATGRRVHGETLPKIEAGLQAWSWDGLDASGRNAPSGVYYVRLISGGRVVTGTGVLLR